MDTQEKRHTVGVHIPVPEHSSRLLAFLTLLFLIPKMLILIPHLVVMWFLGIAGFFVGLFAQVAVLFTGRYPAGMHRFVTGILRWQVRVNAYMIGLRDEYPPFTFEE